MTHSLFPVAFSFFETVGGLRLNVLRMTARDSGWHKNVFQPGSLNFGLRTARERSGLKRMSCRCFLQRAIRRKCKPLRHGVASVRLNEKRSQNKNCVPFSILLPYGAWKTKRSRIVAGTSRMPTSFSSGGSLPIILRRAGGISPRNCAKPGIGARPTVRYATWFAGD
jgi:hypothetical protein